jgi:ribosomal protein S18 acetylase RimI-like enzyme
MITIREYRAEDYEEVAVCFVELQDHERGIDEHLAEGSRVAKKYLDYMFSRCAETGGKVFVAEREGRVVGFVSVWAKVKTKAIEVREHEYAYVSDLVVLSEHRGHGTGKALLQRAEDYARLEGVKILRINVLAKNKVARALYLSLGFEERIVELSKGL